MCSKHMNVLNYETALLQNVAPWLTRSNRNECVFIHCEVTFDLVKHSLHKKSETTTCKSRGSSLRMDLRSCSILSDNCLVQLLLNCCCWS